MITRAILIALILTTGFFSACSDKIKTEEKLETEVVPQENKTSEEDNTEDIERKRLDSIRQVKEHGHAH